MRKQHGAFFFFGSTAILFLLSVNGLACTCLGPMNARTMRDFVAYYSEGKNADQAVFEGLVEKQELVSAPTGVLPNVMSITGSGRHRAVSIRVLRSYRVETGGEVTVVTGLGGGDCGFDFETGQKYLIYAYRIAPETFSTNICSGTSSLEDAGPALRLLRGEAPTGDDLLDPKSYFEKARPRSYGKACGRITQGDGSPMGGVSVEMTQVRDDPFPPKSGDDPNGSKPDGTFCVIVSPGKYVLTAEKTDFDHNLRWMAYYPGAAKGKEAKIIEVSPGADLRELNFSLRQQRLYTVSFRIVASDGSPLPLDDLGVVLDSPERDALAYHLGQHLEDGKYTMGYVPPGKYVVRTIPWEPSEAVLAKLAKWRMADQEVEIDSDAEIVLKLKPAK